MLFKRHSHLLITLQAGVLLLPLAASEDGFLRFMEGYRLGLLLDQRQRCLMHGDVLGLRMNDGKQGGNVV